MFGVHPRQWVKNTGINPRRNHTHACGICPIVVLQLLPFKRSIDDRQSGMFKNSMLTSITCAWFFGLVGGAARILRSGSRMRG